MDIYNFLNVLDIINTEKGETEFSKIRSSYGVYLERTGNFMVRGRVNSGEITPEQGIKLISLGRRLNKESIHITTRQDIQFHDISKEELKITAKELEELGFSVVGTGGNTIRNIVISPKSGYENEEFDVSVHVKEVSKKLKDAGIKNDFPRKYKIAFSNNETDDVNAQINDLGFIAIKKNDIKGFKVYGGGGMGKNPRQGILLQDFITEEEVYVSITAMAELFNKYGNRENKHKARIRYILDNFGETRFKEEYLKLFFEKSKEKDLKLNLDNSSNKFEYTNKENLYLHPLHGKLKINDLEKIINFIKEIKYKTKIRLTNTQGLYILGLNKEDKKKGEEIFYDLYNQHKVLSLTACTGASTCTLGFLKTDILVKEIIEFLKTKNEKVLEILPNIGISGCINSCGQHLIFPIGFMGKKRKTENGNQLDIYEIFLGGRRAEVLKIGESYGDIERSKIKDFLFYLGEKILESKKDYQTFVDENKIEIENFLNYFK